MTAQTSTLQCLWVKDGLNIFLLCHIIYDIHVSNNLLVITRFLPLKKNMQQPPTNLLIKSQSLRKSSILSTLSIIIIFALCGSYFMDYSSVTLKWLSSQGIYSCEDVSDKFSFVKNSYYCNQRRTMRNVCVVTLN